MAVIATGFFDGVHKGHRRVIEALVSEARARGDESLVITFWPHPRMVLQSDARDLRFLTSLDEKKRILMDLGVDEVIVVPFTHDFAELTAREYLKFLMFKYEANCIVLGYDTRLGADQQGPAAVSELCSQLGLDSIIAPQEGEISSTRIRKALAAGDVEAAREMSDSVYRLHGVVVGGNGIGRTLGYPTANMQLYDPLKIIPGRGVYFTEVHTLGRDWYGMTNVGVRPTVSDAAVPVIETNIFDFNESIYGLDITVGFLHKIRDERKFDSLDSLRAQLAFDSISCRAYME